MESIAQEALYGTWGSGTITGPISMYDMINGGNSHGSGNSYPTVNDDCTPNPVDRSYYQVTLQLLYLVGRCILFTQQKSYYRFRQMMFYMIM